MTAWLTHVGKKRGKYPHVLSGSSQGRNFQKIFGEGVGSGPSVLFFWAGCASLSGPGVLPYLDRVRFTRYAS